MAASLLSKRLNTAVLSSLRCHRVFSASHLRRSDSIVDSRRKQPVTEDLAEPFQVTDDSGHILNITQPELEPHPLVKQSIEMRTSEDESKIQKARQYYDVAEVLFVGNTPPESVSDAALKELFGPFGKIKSISRCGRLGLESLVYFQPKPTGRMWEVIDSITSASRMKLFTVNGRKLYVAPATHCDVRRVHEDVVAVLNTPPGRSSSTLRKCLQEHGAIDAHVQYSMRRAFVRMRDANAAQELLLRAERGEVVMDDVTLDITRDNQRIFTHGSRGLFLRSLPHLDEDTTKWKLAGELYNTLLQYGEIEQLSMLKNGLNTKVPQHAFVAYTTEAGAHLALNAELTVRGHRIRAQLAPMWMAQRYPAYRIPGSPHSKAQHQDDSPSIVKSEDQA